MGYAVGALICVFQIAPLVLLKDAGAAFSREQLQELALIFLKLHGQGFLASRVMLGTYNLLIGYLIVRSTFIPRTLGALLGISGVCYWIKSFASLLSPAFAAHLVPNILIPGASELLVPGGS